MDEMISLRCKYCGAPLDEEQVRSDSQYVTCQSCGTTQQRMDAKRYLDQLMGEIKSWISSAIPMGFGISGVENVDPVARHSIFTKDVKPKIEIELNEFRFSNMSLLGNRLFAMPFTTTKVFRPVHSANRAFDFNAKVKALSPLAVDQESRDLVADAASLSQSYAMMINNVELMSENKEGRYALMANNFSESGKAMRNIRGKEVVAERFEALSLVCDGTDRLLAGDLVEAEAKIREGRETIASLKDRVFTSPEFGIMYQGIEQELSICNILLNVIEITRTSVSEDPLKTVNVVSRVLSKELPDDPKWGYLLRDNNRMNEVLANIDAAMDAKNGSATIAVVSGTGDVLVPFWKVDVRYSFETGALWKKRSVEVNDTMLVCADFVTDPKCLSDPASAVTDIFRLSPKNGMMAEIKGEEVSMSNGRIVADIVGTASDVTAENRRIVMPMSTRKETEKLCNDYLANFGSVNKKFKLSIPEVKGIVYIPCIKKERGISSPILGDMVPPRITRMSPEDSMIL